MSAEKEMREIAEELREADARGFRALVTGSIAGALTTAAHLLIEVEVVTDDAGNYQPEILVTGRESGTRLRVSVEILEDET